MRTIFALILSKINDIPEVLVESETILLEDLKKVRPTLTVYKKILKSRNVYYA